jgi:hypothetical protein
VTPVVDGWVRGQNKTGSDLFFDGYLFGSVFKLPSPRNSQRRDKNETEKNGLGFFVDFFVKPFRHDLFAERFW